MVTGLSEKKQKKTSQCYWHGWAKK